MAVKLSLLVTAGPVRRAEILAVMLPWLPGWLGKGHWPQDHFWDPTSRPMSNFLWAFHTPGVCSPRTSHRLVKVLSEGDSMVESAELEWERHKGRRTGCICFHIFKIILSKHSPETFKLCPSLSVWPLGQLLPLCPWPFSPETPDMWGCSLPWCNWRMLIVRLHWCWDGYISGFPALVSFWLHHVLDLWACVCHFLLNICLRLLYHLPVTFSWSCWKFSNIHLKRYTEHHVCILTG